MLTIMTEKVVIRGEKKRKIIGIEGILDGDAIPSSYKDDQEYYCIDYTGNRDLRINAPNRMVYAYLSVGDILCEDEFETIIKDIRRAGERLHVLRKEAKKLEETWKGRETIVI